MYRRQGANARTTNGARASVKNQRRVNQQQPKKKNGPQKENTHKQQGPPVGFSGVSLSSRFSSLQREALVQNPVPKTKKATVTVNVKKGQQQTKKIVARNAKQQQQQKQQQKQQQQKQKMQLVTQANRTKRQAAVNQRRKGLEVTVPVAKKKPFAVGKKKAAPVSKGHQAVPKKDAKKTAKPVTGEDLDIEMDSYWHEAGKGPDPHQAQLDRQMDEYWAGKPKRENGEGETEGDASSV